MIKIKEPIRVLQIVTQMDRAGLESFIMNIYRNIDRSKVQFDFLKHRNEKGAFDKEIISLGGKIYSVSPITPKTLLGSYMKELDSFFTNHPEYKIVHSHINSLSTYPLIVAKKKKIPCRIAHSHIAYSTLNLKGVFKYFSKQAINQQATEYFACSNLAGTWLFGKEKVNLNDVKVVKNAVDTSHFAFNNEKRLCIRKDLGLTNNFIVGHVGRFNEQKNHKFLIEIFEEILKKNKQAILLLIGEGELESEIRRLADQKGMTKGIKFLGVRKNISDYMQAMDVFVMPSLYEGLPVVGIEAQTSGLKLVVSDRISKELKITDNVNFLSLNENPEIWADSIIKYSKSYCRINTHKQIVEAGYDVKENAKSLQDFYLDKVSEIMW